MRPAQPPGPRPPRNAVGTNGCYNLVALLVRLPLSLARGVACGTSDGAYGERGTLEAAIQGVPRHRSHLGGLVADPGWASGAAARPRPQHPGARAARFKDPSADRCLSVQVAPRFLLQPAQSTSACCLGAAPPSASVLRVRPNRPPWSRMNAHGADPSGRAVPVPRPAAHGTGRDGLSLRPVPAAIRARDVPGGPEEGRNRRWHVSSPARSGPSRS
jgi:hypothetical protein